MDRIYVLFDHTCSFCVRCVGWLQKQRQFVPIECIAASSRQAKALFPNLQRSAGKEELIVVDADGGVHRDGDAWLITLWALVDYRSLALRFSTLTLRPLARQIFLLASTQRRRISSLMQSDETLASDVVTAVREQPELCADECALPADHTRRGMRVCAKCFRETPVDRGLCHGCLATTLLDPVADEMKL